MIVCKDDGDNEYEPIGKLEIRFLHVKLCIVLQYWGRHWGKHWDPIFKIKNLC